MKKHILIQLILFLPVIAFSQQLTQTIKGKVVDGESLQPLIGATVVVLNTKPLKGTTTDLNGDFRLTGIPIGRQSIKISYVGYQTQIIPEIMVSSVKEINLDIKLTESATNLGSVTVKASGRSDKALNEMASLNARAFSVEETKRYAASISDPARMALSYAGITNGNDATNQIIIRGNSPNELLWRLQGVEIPAPSHFAEEGYAAGYVSILNANMLSTSDFYIGGFPAGFCDAFSGAFDIRLRQGNSDKREYAFKIGALGTGITMEGPYNKKHSSSYLVNYRYSTLSLLQHLGVNILGNDTPKYQDMSYNLYFPTKKAGVFSVWGIGGLGADQSLNPVKDSTLWKIMDDKRKYYINTGMGAMGITNTLKTGSKSYLRSVISLSGTLEKENIYQLDSVYNLQSVFKDKFVHKAFRVNSYLNIKISPKLTARTGIGYNLIGFNMFAKEREGGSLVTTVQQNGHTSYYFAYNQEKYRLTNYLTLDWGLSYTYMLLGHSQSLDPMGSIQWSFSPNQTIGLAIGKYSRHEELGAYFMAIPVGVSTYSYPNKNLKLKKTVHFVLSYTNYINDALSFKADVYYQYLYDLPIASNKNSTFSTIGQDWSDWNADSLVSNGIGRNYGLELSLNRQFARHYYYRVTASLFSSKYRAADGHWYNTQYNSNYVFNLIGGKEFVLGHKKNKILGFNARSVYAGGQRYTPIDVQASQNSQATHYLQKQRFIDQFPPYFRIDIGINYRINRPKTVHILSLNIQNLTNRQNVQSRYYDIVSHKAILNYGLGMVPIISYKIEF